MSTPSCPKCNHAEATKSGVINERQRYRCRACGYHYTVQKEGRAIDSYYVVKALQLVIEGVSYREIERLLGVSHVSVLNWVKKYGVKAPKQTGYHPTYKILNHGELLAFLGDQQQMKGAGMVITELGDKYMVIRWERFRGK